MVAQYHIDLTINMPDGGRHARQLLNMYLPDMPADINLTANRLFNANAAVQSQKFANLIVKRADVWSNQEHSLKIFVLLSVSGDESALIKEVIAKYMDGFSGCLKAAADGYFSRADVLPDASLHPTDWTAEVR